MRMASVPLATIKSLGLFQNGPIWLISKQCELELQFVRADDSSNDCSYVTDNLITGTLPDWSNLANLREM